MSARGGCTKGAHADRMKCHRMATALMHAWILARTTIPAGMEHPGACRVWDTRHAWPVHTPHLLHTARMADPHLLQHICTSPAILLVQDDEVLRRESPDSVQPYVVPLAGVRDGGQADVCVADAARGDTDQRPFN